MKTILVPLDFSKASQNALQYAGELAHFGDAQLILCHVYSLPTVISEVPVVLPTSEELEESSKKKLTKIEKKLHLSYGFAINSIIVGGFAEEEIVVIAEKYNADLIVMGMKGAGIIAEKIIGSVTTSVIQKSKVPVLSINEHLKFRRIDKIALAVDYLEMKNAKGITVLKEIAKLFEAHIFVVNVVEDPKTMPTITSTVAGIKLDHVLEGVAHSFHLSENKDVIEGINSFVDLKKIDMTVMVPRHHTFLKTVFTEANTKKMAFHASVPLLILPE